MQSESAKSVLREHQDLNILVRDLGKVAQWEVTLLLEVSVRERLHADLHELCVQLERHFAIEEAGHYLEEIGRRHPAARDELVALHDEHPRLMDLFSKARDYCEGKLHQGPEVLQALLLEAIQLLRRHEQRETALVQKVFAG